MKLAFSDKLVDSYSFIELCNSVQRYGFDGVEISDAEIEKKRHQDSIFRSAVTVDAKRKLVNRHIEIPVLTCPIAINEQTACSDIHTNRFTEIVLAV